MRVGKISESVLKRSVLRLIENSRREVIKGAGIGVDCAFLSWEDTGSKEGGRVFASATETISLPVRNPAYLAVMAAANNLAASGAEALAVSLSITLPPDAEEAVLKELMGQAGECCRKLGIQITGGHTEVSSAVKTPVVTATAMGKASASVIKGGDNQIADSMDIVVSKWIGMEGTAIIAREKEEELFKRYPIRLIHDAQAMEECLSVASEAAIALKSGVYAMHDVRSGGIFGALWELSRRIGVGLNIDLKKIPVKQETIEICEFYHLNPYALLSGGALIMAASDGGRLVGALEAEGIAATIIGNTNGSNDKIIVNQDETRYLEPAGPDEILKMTFI
ncbi:MAG: hydrogenase maturation factor [Lachnospiraceae bacterium]|nr:hydrogenase maturation factor [Lachnospiraceae bacterium]MDE6185833.1 hydrogenase maturation factor [Lachnospiraceae bacterium]